MKLFRQNEVVKLKYLINRNNTMHTKQIIFIVNNKGRQLITVRMNTFF